MTQMQSKNRKKSVAGIQNEPSSAVWGASFSGIPLCRLHFSDLSDQSPRVAKLHQVNFFIVCFLSYLDCGLFVALRVVLHLACI